MWTPILSAILMSGMLAMADGEKPEPTDEVSEPTQPKFIFKEIETFDPEDFLAPELEGEVRRPRIIIVDGWSASDWEPMIREREHFLNELVEGIEKL